MFFYYDCNMNQTLLLSIIEAIEESVFLVCSMVCDMGGGNRGLLSALSINAEKNYFVNTFDRNRNIYVFADPSHLLKLIRNNVLDHDIQTPNGLVDIGPYKEIVDYYKRDLKVAPKISEASIIVNGTDKQNV